MRRATGASLRNIDCSLRAIEATSRFAAQRPFYATVKLVRVGRWIARATAQLGRARSRLHDTLESIERAPHEGWGAPGPMFEATQQWIVAASRLAVTSELLEALMAEVLRYAKEGVVDPRPVVATPRPAAARWFLRYCPPLPSGRIQILLQRRRRPARTAPADAPRRVSRGRAPPFLSTCPL